jgi:hypothetical protein
VHPVHNLTGPKEEEEEEVELFSHHFHHTCFISRQSLNSQFNHPLNIK